MNAVPPGGATITGQSGHLAGYMDRERDVRAMNNTGVRQ